MAKRSFFCYDDGSSPDIWQDWNSKLDPTLQEQHDTMLDFLEQREQHQWRSPYSDHITHRGESLIEWRIRGKVHHRIFGYFGPSQKEFTIFKICFKKGKNYYPPDALDTAVRNKKAAAKDQRKVKRCARPR